MNAHRILVVDDREENRYFLRTLLQGAGCAVEEATHGAEALELARRTPPDLVVADILMPVMDGFALCREWKRDARLRSIPFVFFTGTYTNGRDRDFALSIGADEFIVKPQEPEMLLKSLQDVLRAGPRRAAAPTGEQEEIFLRQYNATLVRKLETKMEQLEQDAVARQKAEDALRESQETLALFMRHSPIYSFIKQVSPTESRVLVASENYQQMIGIPGSQMQGKTMAELFPPEFAAKITADDWAVVQKGDVLKLDEELNGRQYTTIKFPIVREGKTLLAGYTIDVTEQKQVERALRDSEARQRELFSNMTSGVAVYEAVREGEDFRFKDINQAGLVIDGVRREDLIGKAVTEVFPGIREMGLLDVLRRVWKTGVAEYYPATHYADGRLSHWYENHVYKLPSGEVVAVYDNVTDRKRAEEALAANYSLLRIAGRTAALGGWSADLAENRVIWSDEVAAIHDMPAGYAPPIEKGISFYAPEWRGRIAKVFRDCVERGIPYDEIMEIVTAQGRRRWVRTIGEAVRDESGRIVKVHGSLQDITDQKTADGERERLQSQLNQLQKIESVGRLAGGVAHDFNNMLGAILGHAEMALENLAPDSPLHAHLLEIQRAAERSSALTRQLLAFARKQTVAPKILDLNQTVEGMLQMLRRLIGENVELAWFPGNSLGQIKIDPSQIDQVLTNLCVNARDAIAGSGQIAIETVRVDVADGANAPHPGQTPGEYVLLAVRDNGCGMDSETLGRLFEPFFTTKEVGQGTGLGLATVYGIVKQNGGFIDVDSAPGRGSTFKIFLPCHGNRAEPAAAAAPAPPVVGGRETILLVEDEPSILAISREMLKSLGYQVLSAATPSEALRQAQAQTGKIHLLITDVVMPEMNGRDLAQQLAVLHPGIRRLFMSGYTADIIAHHGVLDDDIHFIQKPFTLKELAAKVRDILNG